MRSIFSCICLVVFPLTAMAQSYSNAPMLVVTPQTIAAEQTPPAAVVAAIAPSAAAPATATPAATAPAASTTATAPTTTASSTLWPRDTVPIFMTSCTKLKVELVDPCSCIITKVMEKFTHDEFLKMDTAGTLNSDSKMQDIRKQCVDAALQDKKRPANPRTE